MKNLMNGLMFTTSGWLIQNFFAIVLFFLSHNIKANDGAFFGKGGNIFPMKETVIQLKKEVLDLKIESQYIYVSVLFHFNNPTSINKTISVGFVTPPPSGDVNESSIPGIDDFTVNVSGINLDFNIERVTQKNLALGYFGDEFIYLFDATFEPGTTIIKHTYRIRQGNFLNTIFNFNYILSTGLTWANDEIEDFTLNVIFEPNSYFSIPSCLIEKRNEWSFIGNGRLGIKSELVNGQHIYRGYSIDGKLQCKAQNFKPKCDIELNYWFDFFTPYHFSQKEMGNELDAKIVELVRKEIKKNDTRTLRNLLFAIHGYIFKSTELSSLFSKQYWYIPDASIKGDLEILNTSEKNLLEYVKSVELN